MLSSGGSNQMHMDGLAGLLRALAQTESEFKQFLDVLRRLGIKHSINYGPTKKDWQAAILEAGFNVTALACTVIQVGERDYLFCNGKLVSDEDQTEYGPSGLFMFSRDRKTRRVTQRILMDHYGAGGKVIAEGLDAIKRTHTTYNWGPCKEMAWY